MKVISGILSRAKDLVKALRFYAAGEWSDGYPGGVKVREGDNISLDFGETACVALEKLGKYR